MTEGDRQRLSGRVVVASISGGKDSAAMSLWLSEQGIEHRRVFADTGWEHPETYEYLRGELTRKVGRIDEVKSDRGGMAELVLSKGMFPSRPRRFCTEELKIRPLARYIASITPAINAIGIRAQESEARSRQPEWETADHIYGSDCLVWRPMLCWTREEIIAIHRRHGLRPNPLYLRGASRVGCWPCIFARKAEIAMLEDWRVDEIRRLEAMVAQAAEDRYAKRGETFDSLGYSRPAFFDNGKGAVLRNAIRGCPVPIDEVVSWSRTSRGGQQYELFSAQQDGGCVRWGLCSLPEAATPEDAANKATA